MTKAQHAEFESIIADLKKYQAMRPEIRAQLIRFIDSLRPADRRIMRQELEKAVSKLGGRA